MLQLMSNSVIGEEDTEDVVKVVFPTTLFFQLFVRILVLQDLVEVIMKKLDVNRDGQVTYDDFREAVSNQPLMMECLGQCMPTRLSATAFLISFTPYIGKL